MDFDYTKFLSNERMRKTSYPKKNYVEDFYSDRSRIIYSSSFRRLQQKAQVFSLEPNSSVRTRLTHSLEVSDLGKTLANQIGQKLCEKMFIKQEQIPQIVAIVENACLVHDIGNPPFGHFGEKAIQEWAKSSLNKIALKLSISVDDPLYEMLMSDFIEFDGNPQGFRILTKLHCERDRFSLNLTYATLLCALKYSRAAGEDADDGILKKAGYYQTEIKTVEKIYKKLDLELHHRSPFTYIMEAADDIAYCLSDIADGIEKKIITADDFISAFQKQWKKDYEKQDCPVNIPSKIKHFNLDLSVKWSRKIMEQAVEDYFISHKDFYNGEAKQLIDSNGMGRVLATVKKVTRELIYCAPEAENIELTGYAVISGILSCFSKLLELPYEQFSCLINNTWSDKKLNCDYEWRLYNRIGKRYIDAYKNGLSDFKVGNNLDNSKKKQIREWWLRVHLIIDQISGMTDDYALSIYQMLKGIKVNSH